MPALKHLKFNQDIEATWCITTADVGFDFFLRPFLCAKRTNQFVLGKRACHIDDPQKAISEACNT